jgi:hypothetical protein
MLYRLLLAVPADLVARVWAAAPNAAAPPGSFSAWLEAPTDSSYVKAFVLTTWWIGALLGGVVLWKRGQRLTDALCGIVAGAVFGLLASATLACLLPWLDWLPRAVLKVLQPAVGTAEARTLVWLWTPLWIALAAGCWGLAGALGGFCLQLAGNRGLRLLSRAAQPWSWTFGAVGMKRAAAFFLMSCGDRVTW